MMHGTTNNKKMYGVGLYRALALAAFNLRFRLADICNRRDPRKL